MSGAGVGTPTHELLASLQLLRRTESTTPLPRLIDEDPLGDAGVLAALADASILPAPAQLDVLSRAVSSGLVDNEDLVDFAASLVRPDAADRERVARQLIDRLGPDYPGDPFARDPGHLLPPARRIDVDASHEPKDVHSMVGRLARSIGDHIWDVECCAGATTVGGKPVLRIASDLYTRVELDKLVHMADPMQWSQGPLGTAFFREVTLKDGSTQTSLGPPDWGWSGVVSETVDFSLGLRVEDHEFTTLLDVTHWHLPDAGAEPNPVDGPWNAARSVGMTYRLNPDSTSAICFDSGYVIIDELVPPVPDRLDPGLRRVRSLKEVAFVDRREQPFAAMACPIWNWATCLIAESDGQTS